ncbi:MAG: hypothetical protein IJ423_05680 [Clostridia bacterium]|nr:hypothetical protein [Clostridia bacterium]MBQ8637461.1 hypothetical protein [Clostridia bacterium]
MLVCNGKNKYQYNDFAIKEADTGEKTVFFTITESMTQAKAAELFADNSFYVYDAFSDRILFDAHETNLKSLSITYTKNSTCKIIIKLTQKGVVDDES